MREKKYKISELRIYTDGSCRRYNMKDSIGCVGWAFVVLDDENKLFENSGVILNGTNNQGELTAMVKALQYVESIKEENVYATFYSDSAYLINGIKDWMPNIWIPNGWINYQKKEVLNKDLWLDIAPFLNREDYYFEKVKAHENNYWNNYVDAIARDKSMQLYKIGASKNDRRVIV